MDAGDLSFINVQPPSKFVIAQPTSDTSDYEEEPCLIAPDCKEKESPEECSKYLISRGPTKLNENCLAMLNYPQGREQIFDSNYHCPTCGCKRRSFFCARCIQTGNFTHSKKNFLERFADKKLKLIKLKTQLLDASAIVKKQFDNQIAKDRLNLKINEISKNIKTLSKIIAEEDLSIKDTQAALDNAKRDQLKSRQKQIKLKDGIAQMKNQLAKQSVSIGSSNREIKVLSNETRSLIQEKIFALTNFIINLKEVSHQTINDDMITDDDNSEDMPLISRDNKLRSIQNDNLKVVKYQIVDTWIDANENYTEFAQQTMPIEYMNILGNSLKKEYRIISALAYLCQLTNLIAITCDIHLPRKLLFSEFICKVINKEDYMSKIARLSANVWFLCIINRIDLQSLLPKQLFKNLITFLHSPITIGIFDRNVEIPSTLFKLVQESLINEINSAVDRNDNTEMLELSEEQDYDIVENNIPDLNFQTIDQHQSFVSLFSSIIYKHAPFSQR